MNWHCVQELGTKRLNVFHCESCNTFAAAPASEARGPFHFSASGLPRARQASVWSLTAKERAERLFQWKQEGVQAASAYEAKEQATRLLTAKLRAERLAREAMSGKPDRKKVAKV
jgi:hypothetical protein